MTTTFKVEGPRGGLISIDLRSNRAWRGLITWLTKNADDRGWASTTGPELARVLYPADWTDNDHKLQVWRQWAAAGLVVDTGLREYALGQVDKFSVGLTMRGVGACRELGLRDVPKAVAATPLSVNANTETIDLGYGEVPASTADTPVIVRRVDGGGRSGPPAEVTAARLMTMRNVRDALTYALYLNDHPDRCQRRHTDELSAEELFDLAVAKAKGVA